jgi:hypothetical protein
MKLSKPDRFGPVYSLVTGLFPSVTESTTLPSLENGIFFYHWIINASLTGGFSFMQLNGFWFAVKAEPLILRWPPLSHKDPIPLVKTIL